MEGGAVARKRAGPFVDGARFERGLLLWYSESPNACENYRACRIFDCLEASRTVLRGEPGAICALFGYPAEALAEARRAEAAQPAGEAEWAMRNVKAALAACAAFLVCLFRAVFRWFI